jgi:GT2 family glycosyltransferase
MSKVSVSIVLYNTNEKILNEAINSCVNSMIPIDIYLIDNSRNNNLSYFKQDDRVRYLKARYNGGFGAGHNLGIHEFKILESYDYHLVMNPDITFDPSVIGEILKYMEKELKTGVLMPRILNQDGTLQFARRLLPKPIDIFMKRFFVNSSYARKYEMVFCEPNKPVEIVGLCGCFLFFSTKALKTAGLFDERYFMYFEDFDICRRVSKFYKTIYYPKVEVIHDSNREHRRNLKLFYCSIIATMKYFKKWGYIDKDRERINARVYEQVADSEF